MKLKALIGVALAGALALSACGGSNNRERVEIGPSPDWAANPTDVGELIGTTHTDSWQIDIFQVGNSTALRDSIWEDRDTGDNLLPAGTELVVVNYVWTNVSDEPLHIHLRMGEAVVKYEGYKYLGGLSNDTSEEIFEPFGLNRDVVKEDVLYAAPDIASFYATVEPGQSVGSPESFEYQPDKEYTFEFKVFPTNESGETDFGTREESPRGYRISLN